MAIFSASHVLKQHMEQPLERKKEGESNYMHHNSTTQFTTQTHQI
jgi:hypothetical protein